jgi:hyperosmotically inducible periplasmic protein
MEKRKYYWCFLGIAAAVLIFSGCATTRNTGSVMREGALQQDQSIAQKDGDLGQRNQDAGISSAIKTAFAGDKMLSSSRINVDTSFCNVTLNGTVDSQAEADRAMRLGRSVDGVRTVRSNLIVE